jgi:hypothetical protein
VWCQQPLRGGDAIACSSRPALRQHLRGPLWRRPPHGPARAWSRICGPPCLRMDVDQVGLPRLRWAGRRGGRASRRVLAVARPSCFGWWAHGLALCTLGEGSWGPLVRGRQRCLGKEGCLRWLMLEVGRYGRLMPHLWKKFVPESARTGDNDVRHRHCWRHRCGVVHLCLPPFWLRREISESGYIVCLSPSWGHRLETSVVVHQEVVHERFYRRSPVRPNLVGPKWRSSSLQEKYFVLVWRWIYERRRRRL